MRADLKKHAAVIAASLVVALGFSACETAGETALAGAATGAAIGGLATKRASGALTGAAIGAGAGYVGHKLTQPRRTYYTDDYYDGPRDRVYVERRHVSRRYYYDD